MNLQTIKSTSGKIEYVLLPINIYNNLKIDFGKKYNFNLILDHDYVPFKAEDYIENPVALCRIKAGLTQSKLAKKMKVTQAYISKLENQKKISAKILHKINKILCS